MPCGVTAKGNGNEDARTGDGSRDLSFGGILHRGSDRNGSTGKAFLGGLTTLTSQVVKKDAMGSGKSAGVVNTNNYPAPRFHAQ